MRTWWGISSEDVSQIYNLFIFWAHLKYISEKGAYQRLSSTKNQLFFSKEVSVFLLPKFVSSRIVWQFQYQSRANNPLKSGVTADKFISSGNIPLQFKALHDFSLNFFLKHLKTSFSIYIKQFNHIMYFSTFDNKFF